MIAWFKNRKARKDAAAGLFESALAQARSPVFYERLGVADSIDGRFDLIILHVYLIQQRLGALGPQGRKLSQALFDKMFVTMDFTLREIGVGDLGVPKHMKRMMKAFNGRAHSYHDALAARNTAALELAVARNIFRMQGEAMPAGCEAIASYIFAANDLMASYTIEDFMSGEVQFPPVDLSIRKEAAYG